MISAEEVFLFGGYSLSVVGVLLVLVLVVLILIRLVLLILILVIHHYTAFSQQIFDGSRGRSHPRSQ
jgi:hypothetical protein